MQQHRNSLLIIPVRGAQYYCASWPVQCCIVRSSTAFRQIQASRFTHHGTLPQTP